MMCGIVAAVSSGPPLSDTALAGATWRLRHRGCDGQRVWMRPDRRVALGHARLAIIDLATGEQPIANEDGRLRLVVNGEFYDFESIRRDLIARGHRFRTASDSEIALHLYEERGVHALHALRGEFAFALWDERDGQLFAARDRFGIKPLYYAVHAGACYLASEVAAFRDLGVPLRWDRETLFDTHFVAHAPERTLFAGIYQVPPGCYLLTNGDRVQIRPYWDWDLPLDAEAPEPRPVEEWTRRIQDALAEAVRLRLRADVPVACYLSGGLDSSAVLGYASRAAARPVRAFTLSFDAPEYDEAAIAERQARFAGAEFCRVDIRAEQLADHFADAVCHAERPIANAHAVAKYLLSRAVRDAGIKVVLTGEGGDELFAGYPEVRRDLDRHQAGRGGVDEGDRGGEARDSRSGGALATVAARTAHAAGATATAAATTTAAATAAVAGAVTGTATTAPMLAGIERTLGYVPTNLEIWSQFSDMARGLLCDDFTTTFAARDPYRILLNDLDVHGQLRGRHPLNQSLYIWGKTLLPNYILSSLGDRMEMAHSVEGRLPLLDHRLACEAAALPIAMKIRNGVEKYALREAARPVVTDEVYARKKQAFVSPPATHQPDRRLYAFLQDTLRSRTLDGPGIYDRTRVIALLDSMPTLQGQRLARTDAIVTWMASLCLLGARLGL